MITKRTTDLEGVDFARGEVILINKELNATSCALVTKVKRIINFKKIGHAGTLDPKATGLMILCTGKETKSIAGYQDLFKEYRGKIFLGKTTPTMDTESLPENEKDISEIGLEEIQTKANEFLGETDQVPPAFSAVRVNGKRAYKLARKGRVFELKSKKIQINKFNITGYSKPVLSFEVSCSKGTYIRKLAFDLGEKLGCGAYLLELERSRIGEFQVEESLDLDELKKLFPHKSESEQIQ